MEVLATGSRSGAFKRIIKQTLTRKTEQLCKPGAKAISNMNTKIASSQTRPAASLDSMLGPGEKVLWRGKPVRRAFVFRTWPLSVFGLLLVVSVFCFETVILNTEAPDWLALYAVPFGLAGLYMLVGHFL